MAGALLTLYGKSFPENQGGDNKKTLFLSPWLTVILLFSHIAFLPSEVLFSVT